MSSAMTVGAVGVAVLVALMALAALKTLVAKMVSDELRARVDDLPAAFVGLALRMLPAEMRGYYRPDWEGNLLAAFNDDTSRYPVTRFFRSWMFGLSLIVGAQRIRRETKLVRDAALVDEREERLVQQLVPATGGSTAAWASLASCRTMDVEEMFVRGSAARKAALICRQCPVITECAVDALEHRTQYGVWGGMTERERKVLLRRHPEVDSWAEFFAERG